MKELEFASIACSQYLRQAGALFRSIRTTHPTASCYLLLIDCDDKEHIEYIPDFVRVFRIEDLNLSNLSNRRDHYTLFEYCNVARPYFFQFLLESFEINKLIYLDADIQVFNPLLFASEVLESFSFCCCPHILQPFPDDGQLPDDETLLKFGVFNSGFIGFSNTKLTMELLRFLQSRSRRFCVNNPPLTYVDQRILTTAISLYIDGFRQINDSGYNVAYWNLHERNLRYENNSFSTNKSPLVFFHFSGYSMNMPHELTRWPYRKESVDHSVLDKLLSQYQHVLERSGSSV